MGENVEVEGEPAATVTWSFKNKYYTTINFENAQRKQTGMYKIVAVNEHGKDEDEVEFVILGPPGPPIGPLVISDVHKEGCKVAWNPPLDDGGSPITGYSIEKQDVDTGKWTVCGRTDGDLTCNLEGLETGRKFRFRVRAHNEEG